VSTLGIVLIAVGALLLLLFLGGFLRARARANRPEYADHVAAADRALEQARASDRGWDRELLRQAALAALEAERPGSQWDGVELVLVDDKPGVTDDVAHLVASGPGGQARVVLTRREGGDWYSQRVE
jgi:hypothetical protein